MEEVIFENFNKGKTKKSWNFKIEYPSVLKVVGDSSEIWISEERLKVPVGKQKVVIKFFIWLKYNRNQLNYDCILGMVPDFTMLDDHNISSLVKLYKKELFFKKPYYYLLNNNKYRDLFLIQRDVSEEDLDKVKEQMEIAVSLVERNLIFYLEGGYDRTSSPENKSNGWAVLVRARSGSI
jgi:hypothetical protein